MVLSHVGTEVDVSTHSNLQWLGEEAEPIEVCLVDVGGQRALQIVAVHQGVHADDTTEQLVAAVDGGVGLAVLHLCLQRHVVQIPPSIGQVADVAVGLQRGAWREEVGALAAGGDVGGESIDGVVGHEVVQVHAVDGNGGIVAHEVGVQRAVDVDGALPLAGGDVSGILCAADPHTALGGHRWNAVVALYVTGQGGHEEAQVLGLGAECHVGAQPAGVAEVGDKAVGTGTEGGGQREVEVLEVHRLQVAADLSLDGKRIVRPALPDVAGQGGHEGLQILAAQVCVDSELQAAGADGVGERQGEIEAQRHVAVGGLQVERGHADAVALHGERAGVQSQPGHVDIVVGQSTVVPVQTAYGVNGCSEVSDYLAGYEAAHTDADVDGVGGHVDSDVGAQDGQTVGGYLPQGLGLGGILGHRVAHQDVQTGVLEPGSADVDGLVVEVYAAALQCEPAEVAFHLNSVNETVGVQPGIFYLQFVDDDLLVQQRQQLHVDDEVSDVGNGVTVVDYPEVVNAEV